MAAKKKSKKKRAVSPVPRGYRTVSPALNTVDAKATIAFCKKVFGAKLRMTMPGLGGKLMHAELEVGDSVIMVSDAVMDPARPSGVFLYVPKVDKVIAKAVAQGATVKMPAMDQFWGDRMGSVVDGQGNIWTIATHIENVGSAEMKKRSKAFAKQMAASAKG
jgi:PhnB protein